MILQLFLAVMLIAGIHEWGHMLAARLFGIRVEQFSIGFPPRVITRTWKGTQYILGAIPLGGYVKLSGMLDESLDIKQLKEPPKPYEFRSKPAWQRLIVMLGGILLNILTGIVIFSVMALSQGETYLPAEVVHRTGLEVDSLGESLGLRTGDRILSISGKPYDRFSELLAPEVFLENGNYYEVEREGERLRIDIPKNFVERFTSAEARQLFLSPRIPFCVGEVEAGSAADQAGIQPGDSIISFAGKPINYIDELRTIASSRVGDTVALTVLRKVATNDKERTAIHLSVFLEKDILGIAMAPRLPYEQQDYGFVEGLVAGTGRAFSMVHLNVLGLRKIVRGEVSARRSLSGPIGIAQMFGGTWEWIRFWYLVGLISVFVALFNLLPIPALDGGHVVFCLYEMIRGKSLPIKFLHYAQSAGMILLLGLMAFILVNDILKLF